MVEIQVKGASKSGHKTSWLINDSAQQVAQSNREWFVFVLSPTPPGSPRCFVVPRDHVVAATWAVHRNWETDPNAAPGTRNTPISRARVNQTVWVGYEDRWDLLGQPTTDVPVLLPEFVRGFILLDRVGLPPNHPWQTRAPGWLDRSEDSPDAL